MEFYEDKFYKIYFDSYIEKGYKETMKNININDYNLFKIFNHSKNEIGCAYNLTRIENDSGNIQYPYPSPIKHANNINYSFNSSSN